MRELKYYAVLWLVFGGIVLFVERLEADQAAGSAGDSPPQEKTTNGINMDDLDKLLDIVEKDMSKLSEIPVQSRSDSVGSISSLTSTLNAAQVDFSQATTTGDLLKQIPGISGRRTSGVNVDPRVRTFNSSQLNASANGMTQRKTLQDVDSVFSQIDPGIIREITVIDGPYTSLYGPGFAFITADLNGPKRYERPEIHSSTWFDYTSNGQILYSRENFWGGSTNWGVYGTYGIRSGNDYHPGGGDYNFLIPARFKRWDGMTSLSLDLNPYSRIEFDMLHTEFNDVDMPGIIYDLRNSRNDQFDLRYIVQEDRAGPQDLMLQIWHQETFFHGDASNEAKQRTFYQSFITDTYQLYGVPGPPVNTLSTGNMVSTGIRLLRTLGDAEGPQWTFGADWRRYEQRYQELEMTADGQISIFGLYFGIPRSSMDDIGVLTNWQLPVNDRLKITVGGRVDYAKANLDLSDPIITQFPIYVDSGLEMPSYSLGMAYINAALKLNKTDTLTVGTGFAMRPPDLAELYTFEPFIPYCGFGNSWMSGLSNLAPEKNWQFDVGLICERKPLRYGFRGFYATIWDYILPIPWWTIAYPPMTHYLGRDFQHFTYREDLVWPSTVNGDTVAAGYQTENIPLVAMAGGDLFGELQVRPGFSIFGVISYLSGENLTPMEYHYHLPNALNGTLERIPGKEPLPNIYPFNGRLSFRFSDPRKEKWGLEFVARFVHDQNEVATSLSELRTPGFSVFDLHGYYRWNQNLRFSLSLENLLNRDYYEPGSVVIMNPSNIPTFIREPGFSTIIGIDGKF